MQPSKQQLYCITLVFKSEIAELTRDVYVRASSRKVAEARALKRNPLAVRVARR